MYEYIQYGSEVLKRSTYSGDEIYTPLNPSNSGLEEYRKTMFTEFILNLNLDRVNFVEDLS